MASPRLDDDKIFELKEGIQAKQIGVNRIDIRFNEDSKDIYVDVMGLEGIPQTEDYYDNIEDHLLCTELTWLSPLSSELKVNFDASIKVNPDGTFDHSEITVNLHTVVNSNRREKQEILGSVYPLFKRLIPFRSFLTGVEFGWHNANLRTIVFSMKLDGKKVNAILSNNQTVNTQVLSQWSATLATIIDKNEGRYKHMLNIPIINGRMSTSTFETGLCFKFDGNGKGKRK